MCSTHDNLSKLNSQYNGDHSTSMKIFTLILNKIFIRGLKIVREMDTTLVWNCQLTPTNHVFHIMREVG